MSFPTQFETLADLARLPWFRTEGGELFIEDQAARGAIDVHTHLAMSWILPGHIDLRKETGISQLYLPRERAFSLDNYANQNLTPPDLRKMERDLVLGGVFRGGAMRATHTGGTLAREMKGLGVRKSVLLPVDLPILTKNAEDWLNAMADHEDFIVFGSVHPFDRDLAAHLDAQMRLGARGIKIHPAIQFVAPDHPRLVKMCQLAGARKLTVFFHCGPVGIEQPGARERCQVDRYRIALEQCPDTTFVLGHTGALQHDRAISLCREFPNVYVELASQGLPVIREILDNVPRDRAMFGSDWPFYHQAMGLAKVLIATEGDDALRRAVLYENAARLLGVGPSRVASEAE